MPRIKTLSEDLANKIAAGEVVERPASVVKELVENAIDAQSRRIFVSLSGGGIRSIQVLDDGEGMDREDALLAFQRHATSKLSREEELQSIMTLGFRGEALPSIASVSNIRLVTRTEEGPEGTELSLEGGKVRSVKSVGAPRGSLFEVRELFYNTPARRKFLKSTQTELSHISDVVFQSALSHPMIHFRLSHEKKGLIDVPAVRSLGDRILQLFGESLSDETLEAHGESPFAVSEETAPSGSLDIFLSRPPLRRNHRKDQYIFINQRPVKSPLLTHAVYDAYGAYLMKGEHPFFVLFLSIDPGRVDVNVHPTKREVRFQNAEPIHQAVRKMIREALSSETILRGADSNEVRAFSSEGRSGGEARRSPSGLQSPWAGWPEKVEEAKTSYLAEPAGRGAEKPQGEGLGISRLPLIRPLGQIYGTFLLAEIDGEFAVIDQHTAQERILYEHFLERRVSGNGPGAVQPLLVPQQIDLPLQRAGILRDALKMLEAFGWKIEEFGETTFLVREVPALATKVSIESFLLDLTEELAELEVSSQAEQPILKMIASMACHGAVRAGQPLTSEEIKALLTTYFERKTPPTCPHGRPVFIKYPLPELEKLFRRK